MRKQEAILLSAEIWAYFPHLSGQTDDMMLEVWSNGLLPYPYQHARQIMLGVCKSNPGRYCPSWFEFESALRADRESRESGKHLGLEEPRFADADQIAEKAKRLVIELADKRGINDD